MDIEKVVGSGTFGVVFKATIKETGERVALKKFKLEIDPQSQGFPMQVRELLQITNRNPFMTVVLPVQSAWQKWPFDKFLLKLRQPARMVLRKISPTLRSSRSIPEGSSGD
jgi:serine/threonine protein kinase